MNTSSDLRIEQLHTWLTAVLPSPSFSIEVASSDASFRRYFRITQENKTWIAMDAPPEHEDIIPFIQIAEFLYRANIPVPQIYAKDIDSGFLLLSDLGNVAYLSILNNTNADDLYHLAIEQVVNMQQTSADEITLPLYDQALLQRELDLFPEWFLSRHLGLSKPDCLNEINQFLIQEAQSQPQFFVHRDYHSRNLMWLDNKPGIIDFQDAVVGPFTYDLVSLLRDCYIEWPQDKLAHWLRYYLNLAQTHNLIKEIPFELFKRWFDLMGLQRHLKVLGIFCRLYYRDGKEGYLKDLPLTLKYVLQVTELYPELKLLHQFLTQTSKVMAVL